MKPVVPRRRADQDVEAAIQYYAEHAQHVVDDFVEALEAAFQEISEMPGSGSPRYGNSFGVPGLRFKLVKRFPYAVFYMEHARYVDVIRVLHRERDIPSALFDAK